MSDDKTNKGGNPVSKEELPVPTFDQDSGSDLGGAPSQSQLSIEDAFKRLETLEKEYRKVIQPETDRGYRKLETQVGDLRRMVDDVIKLKEKGFDPDEIEEKLAIRKFLKEQGTLSSSPQPAATEAGRAISEDFDVSSELKQFNLAANDPQVVEVLRKKHRGFDHLRADLAALAFRKATKPPISAAETPGITGGGISTPGEEQLLSGYTEEMMAARGKPTELRAIKEKYRKAGLPVDKVVLPL